VTTTARYLHPSKKRLAEHINKRNAARAQEGAAAHLESRHTLRHTSVPVQ
jgi:hypothetical protein